MQYADQLVWDDEKARAVRGSLVIVGLTYVNPDGSVESQLQAYGLVTKAESDSGVSIECHGEIWNGQTITLPPDLRSFQKAPPGTYKLRATGEEIIDPDFSVAFTIERAKS